MKRTLGLGLGLFSLALLWLALRAPDDHRTSSTTRDAPPAAARAPDTDRRPPPFIGGRAPPRDGGAPRAPSARPGPMPPPLASAPPVEPSEDDGQVPADPDPHAPPYVEREAPGHPLWRLPPERLRELKLEQQHEAGLRPRAEEPHDPQVALLLDEWGEQFDQLRGRLRAEGHVDLEAELGRAKDAFFDQRRNP